MKSWYVLALVVVFILVFAWLLQVEQREQAATVTIAVDAEDSSWSEPPQAVEAKEDSSWSEPPQAVADLWEELQDQSARVLKQQAHRPSRHRTATAVRPHRQSRTRDTRKQASRDDAQAMLKTDPQEREAQERQRIEQIVSHLDDSFHSEPLNGGWAAQIEESLAEDFEADEWNGHVLADASCRSTLCRLVIAHEAPEAAAAFIARMGTLHAFADTEGFYQQVTLADGTATTVVYIVRQGYRLPVLPSP